MKGGPAHVRVENLTRRNTVAEHVRVAETLKDRTIGLLGTRRLPIGTGLWIRRAPSIHMFFMRYSIDAVFTDADLQVVRIVEGLAPWRVVWWVRGAQDCLEVPVGTAHRTGLEVGDRLALTMLRPAPARTGLNEQTRADPS